MANCLPYYPLYVYDFDEDHKVLAMNLSEVGLYQLALNESWKRGSIPADPKELAVSIRRRSSEVCRAWPNVLPCWVESGVPGRLVNPRQERERRLATDKSAMASVAGIASANARKETKRLQRTYQPYASESVSVSESPSGLEATDTETVSSRARAEFVDPVTFMRLFSDFRGFKKPPRSIRPRAMERIALIQITELELRQALDGYRRSEWGQKQGFPILGFLKDPLSWIPDDVAGDPELPTVAIALQTPTTVQDFVAECEPRFRHYIGVFFVHGKELLLPIVRSAYVRWQALSLEQQESTINHAERNFPNWKLLPNPCGHLDKEPWTAVQIERMVPAPVSVNDKSADRRARDAAIVERMNRKDAAKAAAMRAQGGQ